MLEIMFLFTAAILIRSATQTDIRGDQMSISLENACCVEKFPKGSLVPTTITLYNITERCKLLSRHEPTPVSTTLRHIS